MTTDERETRGLIAHMWDLGAVSRVDCREDGRCCVRLTGRDIRITASGRDELHAVRYAHLILTRELSKREVAA